MEGCEDECKCVVCQCDSCPKNMKAHLSVLSRSFDSTDASSVVALLGALRGVESVQASLLQNRAEVRPDMPLVCSRQRHQGVGTSLTQSKALCQPGGLSV